MRWIATGIAAGVFLLLATSFILGQNAAAPSPESPAQQLPDAGPKSPPDSTKPTDASPLSQPGAWDFSVWATQAVGNSAYGDVGDAYVSMAGFRTGYVFFRPNLQGPWRGTLEYFFDVLPVFVLTKPQVIYGAGASPVGFKWNFLCGSQPYLDFSLGGILSTRDLPPGNTSSFNFTVTADGVVTLWSRPRQALTARVGFWHFSNAHLGATNPSLNALEFGIAYHWFKTR